MARLTEIDTDSPMTKQYPRAYDGGAKGEMVSPSNPGAATEGGFGTQSFYDKTQVAGQTNGMRELSSISQVETKKKGAGSSRQSAHAHRLPRI